MFRWTSLPEFCAYAHLLNLQQCNIISFLSLLKWYVSFTFQPNISVDKYWNNNLYFTLSGQVRFIWSELYGHHSVHDIPFVFSYFLWSIMYVIKYHQSHVPFRTPRSCVKIKLHCVCLAHRNTRIFQYYSRSSNTDTGAHSSFPSGIIGWRNMEKTDILTF